MGYTQLTTERGYVLLEVISAIQKEIRRGEEESAFYWSLELIPRYEAYLWRRLVVIVNEDIGIASPELLSTIPHLRDQFFEFRERGKDGTCRLILANAILLMSRAPKTRISDEFQRVVTQRWMEDWKGGNRPGLPDYALDCHTRRGRQMGRDKAHWLEEGCVLIPEAEIENPYHDQAVGHWIAGKEDAPKRGKKTGETDKPTQLSMF